MPGRKTIERARRDKREGKAPTTQAGEFVREEIEHIREGKHGARSAAQAIAIGLSKARRAGVDCRGLRKAKRPRTRATARSARSKRAASATRARRPSARAPSRRRCNAKALRPPPSRALAPSQGGREGAHAERTVRRSEQGSAHQRSGRKVRSRAQGGPHASAKQGWRLTRRRPSYRLRGLLTAAYVNGHDGCSTRSTVTSKGNGDGSPRQARVRAHCAPTPRCPRTEVDLLQIMLS